uniref:Uncharacterized protein n=1 Tax=Arundo donax TaxID=35708 RepID=A0A0A9HE40_ARUDO
MPPPPTSGAGQRSSSRYLRSSRSWRTGTSAWSW